MIINSLLDNDLYKFTMQQVVLHKFSHIQVEYVFTNRGKANLAPYFEQIKEQIYHLENLTMSGEEKGFLLNGNIGSLKVSFVLLILLLPVIGVLQIRKKMPVTLILIAISILAVRFLFNFEIPTTHSSLIEFSIPDWIVYKSCPFKH